MALAGRSNSSCVGKDDSHGLGVNALASAFGSVVRQTNSTVRGASRFLRRGSFDLAIVHPLAREPAGETSKPPRVKRPGVRQRCLALAGDLIEPFAPPSAL